MKVIPPFEITTAGSFTRSTIKTYVNSSSLIQTAGINVPAWTFDPSNINNAPTPSIEVAATNLCLRSETLNTLWSPNSCTVAVDQIASPDGNVTADKITANVGSTAHDLNQTFTGTAAQYTLSVFAKAGTANFLGLSVAGGASTAGAFFNLSTGAVATVSSDSSATIQAYGNGWYRCKLVRTLTAGSTLILLTSHSADGQALTYTALGTESIYAWGAQIELGSSASSYIQTAAATVTRAADTVAATTGLVYSSAVETAPATYAGGSTYAIGDYVSTGAVGTALIVYQSLQSGNIGHTPASSPTYWVSVGNTYNTYDGAHSYSLGDTIQDVTTHLVYESVVNSNSGNAVTDTTKWTLIQPTNKWAAIDLLYNTTTVQPRLITMILQLGSRSDSLCLTGITANSLNVTVMNAGAVVYSDTENLNTRDVTNWYEYFYAPFITKSSLALFDLPPYTGAIVFLSFYATSGNAECGAVTIGTAIDLGDIQYSAQADVLNFSSVTRNFDGGTAAMVQRRNVPKTIQKIWVDKTQLNKIRRFRDNYNGMPAAWIGIEDDEDGYYESFVIVGFYKKFTINTEQPETASIDLEIEEI